ncbi:signal peptidase I [Leptospira ognonensis]|uniref:Signal peptidase I n=1 Tax=Leptospira ognonensis TaxID=2484945 RepID=A0A4R9JVK9_9LEPT|nr:signal peptidase I [Leptospira ognonensis]TGL56351.1 signal peptidase I [Leptospira ognonensis]
MTEEREQKNWKTRLKKYSRRTLYFSIFLAFLLFVRIFLFQIYSIQGNSMYPTLSNGSIVFVWKGGFALSAKLFGTEWLYTEPNIQKLDLVLFHDQAGELVVKRVIGLPNEFYSIEAGRVLIDSQMLIENYTPVGSITIEPNNSLFLNLKNSPFLAMGMQGRIPPGYFLLLGDNREYSTDSRSFGLVPVEKIKGKVFFYF